ncbi:hypothetical protein CRU99_04400 [Malaciobacter mytili]|nr:hypothetical protein CRU99_04400 [Malaciobacter mytili]
MEFFLLYFTYRIAWDLGKVAIAKLVVFVFLIIKIIIRPIKIAEIKANFKNSSILLFSSLLIILNFKIGVFSNFFLIINFFDKCFKPLV